MDQRTPILAARQISKSFLRPTSLEILKSVSLDVFPNESVAIMGASGEGKSTLLHILGTLEAPSSGELVIAGKQIANCPSPLIRNKHIGFIFQSFNLLEDYTVLQNALMPALIAKEEIGKGSLAYERACVFLEKVGLGSRMHFMARLLSGGEKQRVAIARAFCNNPEIILADEPSGNLDHNTSKIIHELLMQSVKESNKCLVVVTHDHELANLCDRKLILCGGMLKEENHQ